MQSIAHILKRGNPYHDKVGRFTFASGVGGFKEYLSTPADAIHTLLHGEAANIAREDVRSFLDKAAKQTEDPNLLHLHVEGTPVFDKFDLGIPRDKMPQIPKDMRDQFFEEINARGVGVTLEQVHPFELHPSQSEISARAVGEKIAKYMVKEKAFPPSLVASDGYILDGHHHWGVMAALAIDLPHLKMPIFRLSVSHRQALALMHAFDRKHGIQSRPLKAAQDVLQFTPKRGLFSKGVDTPTFPPIERFVWTSLPVRKFDPSEPRDSRGRWTQGSLFPEDRDPNDSTLVIEHAQLPEPEENQTFRRLTIGQKFRWDDGVIRWAVEPTLGEMQAVEEHYARTGTGKLLHTVRGIPFTRASVSGTLKRDLIVVLLRKYDPSEPRDKDGQWTTGGGREGQQHSAAFKAWFKDSKIVDAAGKPLVVYHGTPSKGSESNNRYVQAEQADVHYPVIDEFDTTMGGVTDKQWLGQGSYFTPDPDYAYEFGDRIMPVYLSIQHPFVVQDDQSNSIENHFRFIQSLQGLTGLPETLKLDLSLPPSKTYEGYDGKPWTQVFEISPGRSKEGKDEFYLLSRDSKSPAGTGVVESKGATPDAAIFAHRYHERFGGFLLHTITREPLGSVGFRTLLEKNGYDGVIEQTDRGMNEIVAFHPTQIKSALGNRGTFDLKNPSITKFDPSEPRDKDGKWTTADGRDPYGSYDDENTGVEVPLYTRKFTSEQGYEWHEQGPVNEWAKNLPYADAREITNYSSFGYHAMNDRLRGSFKPSIINEVVRPATPAEIALWAHRDKPTGENVPDDWYKEGRIPGRDYVTPESQAKWGNPGFKDVKDFAPDDPWQKVVDEQGNYVGRFVTDYTANKEMPFTIQRAVPDTKYVAELDQRAGLLNDVIAKRGYVLPEAIQVERGAYLPGVTYEQLKAMEQGSPEEYAAAGEGKPAAVYTEKGFTSTMLGEAGRRAFSYPAIAKGESLYNRFGDKMHQYEDEIGSAVRFHIALPAGTKVVSVEAVRRMEYDFPRIPDPSPMPADADPQYWTMRDLTAKPTVKFMEDKQQRSESEILLGSGAQFKVVKVQHGETYPAGGGMKHTPMEEVFLEYIGGGSSDGRTKKAVQSIAKWEEAEHPRDDRGRFTMGQLASKYPVVAANYAKSSGTEMGSIGAHTADVQREWARQLTPQELAGISARWGNDVSKLMDHAISLHDIGKADAIAQGDKHLQHAATVPILQDVLTREGFAPKDVQLATELINHDLLGNLVQGSRRFTSQQVAQEIVQKAAKVGMDTADYATLQLAFYHADAGAYPFVLDNYMTRATSGKLSLRSHELADVIALTKLPPSAASVLKFDEAQHPRDKEGQFTYAGEPTIDRRTGLPHTPEQQAAIHAAWSQPDVPSATFRKTIGTTDAEMRAEPLPPTLQAAEDRIRNEPNEHAFVVRDGKPVIVLGSDSPNHVSLDDDEALQLDDLSGAVLTHNHPSNNGLSNGDGTTAVIRNMAEIRAVTATGTHSLRRTGKQWPDQFMTTLFATHESLMTELGTQLRENKITLAEANHQHHIEIWKRLQQQLGGFVYTFEPKA